MSPSMTKIVSSASGCRWSGVAFAFGTRTSTTEMLPPVWLGRAFIVIRPPSYQNGSPSSARAITALPSHALHMGFLLQRLRDYSAHHEQVNLTSGPWPDRPEATHPR